MNNPLSTSLRLELWLFALFQLAWGGVCLVTLFAPSQLLGARAGDMGSLFGVLGDLNPLVLAVLGAAYFAGGASLFAWTWCGLLPAIGAQLLLSLKFLYTTLMFLADGTPGIFLTSHGLTMLGVLAMSCLILWRLMVFYRTLPKGA